MNNINIFFIKSSEFKKYLDEKSIKYFLSDNDFKSTKRVEQFCLGRFLVNYVLKNFYGLKDFDIVIENKKPCLKDKKVEFSLSHTDNIVLVAFSKEPVGIDVEVIKERNFNKLLEHYKLNIKDIDAELFYRLWTRYEAYIKLQNKSNAEFTFKLLNDYMVSLCTKNAIDIKNSIRIFEIIPSKDIVSLSQLNENEYSLSKIDVDSLAIEPYDELELKIK